MDKLYRYQDAGVLFLAGRKRAYLADVPGLGKTAQAVVAADLMYKVSPLVLCPAIAVPVWRREWARWAGSTPNPTILSYDVIVRRTSLYESLLSRIGTAVDKGGFDLLILDEAQYCKNPDAIRTARAMALAHRAPAVWALSGTPMKSDATDLWPILRAVWPDLLRELVGSTAQGRFLDHFYHWYQSEYGARPTRERNPGAVKAMLDRFMLRRTLDDAGIDLPELFVTETPIEVAVTPALVAAEAEDDGEGPPSATLRRLLGEAKAPEVKALIEDTLDVTPTLIFAYHHSVLDKLESDLAKWHPVRIDGTTSSKRRQEVEAAFQTGLSKVFIGQIGACQTAITLARAERVIIVEPEWTPDANLQAIKRAHRIGTKRPVVAQIIVATNSLDAGIMARCRVKDAIIEAAFEPLADIGDLL